MDHSERAGMVAEVQPGSLVVLIVQEDVMVTKESQGKDTQASSGLTSTNSIPSTFLDASSAESTLLGTRNMTVANTQTVAKLSIR